MATRTRVKASPGATAVAERPHAWDIVRAGSLSGDHIGTLIRVRMHNPDSEHVIVHTAELRQVGHTGGSVYAHIGLGAEAEIELHPDQPVTLKPPADYTDVAVLATYDDLK